MKRYLLNAGRRFQYALQIPPYALTTVWRELIPADERFLAGVIRENRRLCVFACRKRTSLDYTRLDTVAAEITHW